MLPEARAPSTHAALAPASLSTPVLLRALQAALQRCQELTGLAVEPLLQRGAGSHEADTDASAWGEGKRDTAAGVGSGAARQGAGACGRESASLWWPPGAVDARQNTSSGQAAAEAGQEMARRGPAPGYSVSMLLVVVGALLALAAALLLRHSSEAE